MPLPAAAAPPPPPIVFNNELLRDNFVDCVRRIKLRDFLGGEVMAAAAAAVAAGEGVASAVNLGVDFNRNRFLGGKLGVIIEAAEALLCNLYGDDITELPAEPEPEPQPEPAPEPGPQKEP